MLQLKRTINIFALVFVLAFSALFCMSKLKNTPLTDNSQPLQVYEWLHVESFEGGSSSRLHYLNSLAIEYEKINPTTLIMVRQVDASQLEQTISKSTPHLISFSEQVAKTVLPYLKPLDNEYGVQDNFLQSATYNRQLMAIPFIASGYCYFSKQDSSNQPLYTGNNNLHSASSIVAEQTINDGQVLSSYECYTKFVNSPNIKLLGTARDLFRIKNLETLGRFKVDYTPVDSFSDLIQYLGLTSKQPDLLKFADFIMQDNNQRKLINLNLFSTKYLNLYSEKIYLNMEKALKTCIIPNIFVN